MATFSNGESGSSVRAKLNEIIEKVEGTSLLGNDIKFGDNDKAIFGAGSDLKIYHSGSNSFISEAGTGDLYITTNGNKIFLRDISLGQSSFEGVSGGAASLFYAGATKLATTATGVDVTGVITSDGLTLGDTHKAIFGAGSDLQIYHDGFNSYIEDAGTGYLVLKTGGIGVAVQSSVHGNLLIAQDDFVKLYNAGSEKLATTSTGVDVTGTVTADGLTVDGNTTFNSLVTIGSGSYFVSNATNGFRFNNSGDTAQLLYIKNTGEAVFNENGIDYDFRVESDTNTHALFVDAGNSRVGVNASAPVTSFQVFSVGSNYEPSSGTGYGDFYVGNGSYGLAIGPATGGGGAGDTRIWLKGGSESLIFTNATNSNNVLQLYPTAVVVNESGADQDFRVESDTQTHALFVEGSSNFVGVNTSSSMSAIGSAGGGLIVGPGSTNSDVEIDVIAGGAWFRGNSTNTTNWGYSGLQIHNQGSFRWGIISQGGTEAKILSSNDGTTIVENARFAPSGFTFNEDGANTDFRVEADSTSDLFVCEGSGNGLVHIGKSTGNFATAGCSIYPQGEINLTSTDNRTPMWIRRDFNDGDMVNFYRSTSRVGYIASTTSVTTYNTISDRRLKTDVQPIADATDKLMAMNPIRHKWIADPDAEAVHGFIAQEMQEIVPEAVSGTPDGEEMMAMDYGRVTPVLVAALQEALAKIETLEARIAALEAK